MHLDAAGVPAAAVPEGVGLLEVVLADGCALVLPALGDPLFEADPPQLQEGDALEAAS